MISLGSSTLSPSIAIEKSPLIKVTLTGRFFYGFAALSEKVPSHWFDGVPQPSSPLICNLKVCPVIRCVGIIAL